MKDSYFEALRQKGYSRREFLQICAILTASIGLEASFIPKVAYAPENKPRLPVIYLHLQLSMIKNKPVILNPFDSKRLTYLDPRVNKLLEPSLCN